MSEIPPLPNALRRHHLEILSQNFPRLEWRAVTKSARIIRTNIETVVIPAASRERFLMQSREDVRCLDDFQILQAGVSRLTPGYLVDRSPSYFNLMLFCHEGRAEVRAEARSLRMKPGEVLMIPTGCAYSYRPSSPCWSISWAHLIDCPAWNRLFGSVPILQKAHWGEQVQGVMEGYVGEAGTRHPDSAHTLRLYLELLVSYLKRELGGISRENRESRERLQNVWGRVQRDVRHKWTVRELASLAGLCKTGLFQQCEKIHRMTPMDMVTAMRMELAAELLAFTNYTLAMIADETGYKNAFAFSKAFKRHKGASPGEYRRTHPRQTRKPPSTGR